MGNFMCIHENGENSDLNPHVPIAIFNNDQQYTASLLHFPPE